ncbi:prepilin-type N-terminal cleavage/methylation domain-containing protein [Clostridium manihotivorum]|uniref:prepilin-type N-terminal cleavage/methylation domain-containing protein n=1 Tax=Clostridium manihotivorum TaxID=2320868 RepID=UPI0013E299B6|nr:prepilin-type N-terminal cleavage/methylation domain-containing protein [Clostridium manihotivorum]
MHIKKKAFTVIELLITLALIAIVSSIIYSFYLSSSKTMDETNTRSALQQDGQIVQNSLLTYGNQASSIAMINNIAPTSSGNSIQVNSLKLVLYANANQTVEYDYDNTSKRLSEITSNLNGTGSTTKTLSSNVQSIQISPIGQYYNNADGIAVSITLSNKGISYSTSCKLIFRNKGVTNP